MRPLRSDITSVARFTAFLLFVGLLFLPAPAQACTNNWTGGAGDGLWTTAGNWSTGKVPVLSDDVCLDSNAIVTVPGTTAVNSLTNAGSLSLGAGASLNLLSNTTAGANSGVIEFHNASGLGGNVAPFANTGTLRGSAGIAGAGIAPFLQNTGTVVVQSGILTLARGTSSGTFNAGMGAVLDLGDFMINAGASLIGAGTIGFNAFSNGVGTITFDDDTTIDVATLAIGNSTLKGTGFVNVTFNNTVNWSAGTMGSLGGSNVFTFASSATVNIVGRVEQKEPINNAGHVVMSGAGVLTMVLTTFNNQAGATFDIQNIGGIGGGASAFNNAGTLKKSAGAGITQIAPIFSNTGSVLVQSGILTLDHGTSSGIFNAGMGARLDLGVFTINAGASLIGAGTIGFTGVGTLTFAADTTIGVATFVFANGTMKGTGNVSFNNTLNWSGGTMNGTGVINFAATATVNILGNVVQNQTINNAGNVVMSGGGVLNMGLATVFNNQAGATFDIQNNAGIGGGASAFNNAGTLKKSGGIGESIIGPFPVNNSGSIAAQSGTLTLSGGGASGGVLSSFTAASGATLAFESGTFTMNVGAGLSGGGTIAINGATVTFKVDIAIDTATVAFSSGTVNGAGVVTIRHTLNWSGGTMSGSATTTIADTGSINISGVVTLDTRTLTTNLSAIGTMVGACGLVMRNSATVNNTGSFDIKVDCGANGNGTWNNDGSLKKSAGTGTALFGVTFNNSGTVLVQAGTIELSGGGSNSGTMTPALGATLRLSAGIFTVTSGVSFTGGGTVSLTGAILTFAADTSISTAVFAFSSGMMNGVGHATFNDTLNWSGGAMSGSGSTNIAANGTLNLLGTCMLNTRTINSIGAVIMSAGGGLIVTNGAIINNQMSGVFDIQNNGGIAAGAGTPAFHNDGTFKKSGGTGTSTIAIAFTNTSLVQVLSGTLNFTSTYTQTAGSTVLKGGALSIFAPNAIDIEGGTLSGSGTITGNVINNATLKPGASPGMINLTGNYVQGASGVLNMEIAGAAPGTGYSQMNISGSATLDGTLNITLGFTPSNGESFVLLTYASETGNFATINGLNQGGVTFQPNLNPRDFTLVATVSISVTINPSSATIAAAGTQQFTVTVTGTINKAVDWTVQESSGGTTDAAGLYTAPNATGTFHVVATSRADPTKSATATVTVIVGVAITPARASLASGGTQQFLARINGAVDTAITWSIQEGASGGTVDQTGLYTAPPTNGVFHVVAARQANPAQMAIATVAVAATLPRFAYVANSDDNTLSIYTVAGNSGQLRADGYALTGSNPSAVAVASTGKFVYVANQDSNNVSGYSINPGNGTLTVIGSATAAGTRPQAIALDPAAQFAFVANQGSNDVSAYTVDPNSGTLTAAPGSPFPAGTAPAAVLVDPSSSYVFVANANDNAVAAFLIDPTTAALTPLAGSPFPAGARPSALAVSPGGQFVFAANQGSNNVSVYALDETTGTLTPVSGSPFASGTAPVALSVDPTGTFLYVANRGSKDISAFLINPATGALSAVPGSPFADTSAPSSIALDPSGQYLYVGNDSANEVAAFNINAASGALTLLGQVRTRGACASVALAGGAAAVVYTPTYSYTADSGSNDVMGFSIDPVAGTLTAFGPFSAGTAPAAVTADPLGQFAYTANNGSNDVSAFTIDPATGNLTAAGANTAAGSGPRSAVVDPSGRFVYVSNAASNSVSAYILNTTTGVLTPLGSVAAGQTPGGFGMHPAGKFLYVANAGGNNISGYRIDSNTGALAALPGSPFAAGTSPRSITIDASGRFAFAANHDSNDLWIYAIDAATGALTPVTGSPFALDSGASPVSATVDPSGQFLFVADELTNAVAAFHINATAGALTPITGSPFSSGTTPESVAVDLSGQFVLVADQSSNDVMVYAIDPLSGALTPVAGAPFPTGNTPASVTIIGKIQ